MRPLAADGVEAKAPPARAHAFRREAMSTTFTIRVVDDDPVYARRAAAAAFEELDLLERLLSRHEQASDVTRINRLPAGATTVVTPETFDCLEVAQQLKRKTAGAFDVAYGSRRHRRQAEFRLHRAGLIVEVLDGGLQIDLGGVGKGFALDRMARLLREWDVEAAMLWASTSTVLAFGGPQPGHDWTIDFGPRRDRRRRALGGAFSGSGSAVKGAHVVDPRTGRPAPPRRRAWAAAPTAALADGLSTAFLIMSREEIARCCRHDPLVAAYVADGEHSFVAFHDPSTTPPSTETPDHETPRRTEDRPVRRGGHRPARGLDARG